MAVNPNEAPEGYEAVESNGCDAALDWLRVMFGDVRVAA